MSEVFDSSDAKAVQAAVKAAKSKDVIAIEALRGFMGTEGGRVWLYKHLDRCSTFVNAFSPDTATMAFRCGEINIGLQFIVDLQEASPELYLQMIKENK